MKEYTITPQAIDFKNNSVKNIIVRAWLIESRDKKYIDTSTIDVTVRVLYETHLDLGVKDVDSIFTEENCYLKVGAQKFFFNSSKSVKGHQSKNTNSFNQIEYHLFTRVPRKQVSIIPKIFIVKTIDLSTKLEETINVEFTLHD